MEFMRVLFRSLSGDAGQRVQRLLFGALHPPDLLRAAAGGTAAPAGRSAALDTPADRDTGARLPAPRDRAGADHRAVPGQRRPVGAGRTGPLLQPARKSVV